MHPPHASPKLPAILIANHLLDGDVVFWTGSCWSRDPREAAVAEDAATARKFENEARAAFARHEVVDADLIEITRDAAGLPLPNHFRERFRIKGPSHRTDLGKQAEFANIGLEQ
jgi:sulfite reductase (NADPH) hemoprotein beta-component